MSSNKASMWERVRLLALKTNSSKVLPRQITSIMLGTVYKSQKKPRKVLDLYILLLLFLMKHRELALYCSSKHAEGKMVGSTIW
ncbi:hypothetical protein ANAPC1_01442 [Anaplasma phagocytophilum]|uniref:Uncharacterized protein n=1 Tax=Anaplasma phagocytophilum TaxID=948 RepID=A0AA45UUB6_ANAPH|nr:hypothetical protein ANAPC1_01442 [Anaplasma phagocytophilum]SBO30404.1 hypothetical protein ANAPC2_00232 [Anaplasma phagocytophilum]SBO32959.1 hypothetical protein ANAPC4_00987 [Anaplasma phagocytophilum]SCV64251.1 hypothetical protein ANAPC5_00812 [Anaplasma phagocytophilum]